jgi:hypothetical protein
MRGVVKVLRGVLVFGRIATPHVSANQAHTQMDPGIAELDALLAYMSLRFSYLDLVKMRAYFRHKSSCIADRLGSAEHSAVV